jgi:hypothetical protein
MLTRDLKDWDLRPAGTFHILNKDTATGKPVNYNHDCEFRGEALRNSTLLEYNAVVEIYFSHDSFALSGLFLATTYFFLTMNKERIC